MSCPTCWAKRRDDRYQGFNTPHPCPDIWHDEELQKFVAASPELLPTQPDSSEESPLELLLHCAEEVVHCGKCEDCKKMAEAAIKGAKSREPEKLNNAQNEEAEKFLADYYGSSEGMFAEGEVIAAMVAFANSRLAESSLSSEPNNTAGYFSELMEKHESAVANELKLAKQLLSRLSIRLNKQMNNALGSIQEDVALIREIEALLEPK